jgi:hypothetical protein
MAPGTASGRLIQVGDILYATYGSLHGPKATKEVTVAWVSENGHCIRTTEGENYQVPDLIATGRSSAPEPPRDSETVRQAREDLAMFTDLLARDTATMTEAQFRDWESEWNGNHGALAGAVRSLLRELDAR